ncbi:helix-turn-helix domain-containing protein [Amycolatopsis samaneae]|uniref:Helix-turn-helix domain-containing protein n=1 Tax=Amycolatopsis samaneae TaxID=664691 RepID=A0ABW5GI28_9PSEU
MTSAPTADPADAGTTAELAACLRTLRDRRGLTYSALEKAAEALPRKNGECRTLPRSTVSDMLAGKRLPSKDRLLTFLASCRVHPDEFPRWLAAWDRARVTNDHAPPPTARERRSRKLLAAAVVAVASIAATLAVVWATGLLDRPAVTEYRMTTTAATWTHRSPDARDETHEGTLPAGQHDFSCWTVGAPLTHDGYHSSTWVKTHDVYVNSLFLYAGDTADLPRC